MTDERQNSVSIYSKFTAKRYLLINTDNLSRKYCLKKLEFS